MNLVTLVQRLTVLVAAVELVVAIAAHLPPVIGGVLFWALLITGWLVSRYLRDRESELRDEEADDYR